MALPERSVTLTVAMTVIRLFWGRAADEKAILLSDERLTVVLSSEFPAKSENVLLLTVPLFSDSLNESTTVVLGPISTAPLPGVTITTCGRVVSAGEIAVVKLRWTFCRRFPARSLMALLLFV